MRDGDCGGKGEPVERQRGRHGGEAAEVCPAVPQPLELLLAPPTNTEKLVRDQSSDFSEWVANSRKAPHVGIPLSNDVISDAAPLRVEVKENRPRCRWDRFEDEAEHREVGQQ